MRVIGGALKGRRINGAALPQLRPTSDRVRESIFNLLGGELLETRVADLFAGTGALGIEALSRGAREAVFVERDPAALRLLRENIAALGLGERARVVRSSVEDFLGASSGMDFDLVLADPPYDGDGGAVVLELLAAGDLLAPGGLVVIEQGVVGAELVPPTAWSLLTRRVYGDTRVEIFTR